MKKKNLATAMAAAMMFGGVAPVVAHANNEQTETAKDENLTQDQVKGMETVTVDVAKANAQKTDVKEYKDIYKNNGTLSTKDDKLALKEGQEILYAEGQIGLELGDKTDAKYVVASKMSADDMKKAGITEEAVKNEMTKYEDAKANLAQLQNMTFTENGKTEKVYTINEKESKENTGFKKEGNEIKGCKQTIVLENKKAKTNGYPEKVTFVFNDIKMDNKLTHEEEKPESLKTFAQVLNSKFYPVSGDNKVTLDVTNKNGVEQLNRVAYELSHTYNSNNTETKSDEVYENGQINKVITVTEKGTKNEVGQIILKGYDKFKANNFEGFVNISEIKDLNSLDQSDLSWAKPAVMDALYNGQLKGYEDNTLRLNGNVTRAEFARMLVQLRGESVKEADLKENFSDVKPSDWFYKDVATLASLGIVKGDGNGTFRPDDTITRQEAAVMIAKAINGGKDVDKFDATTGKALDTETTFTDDEAIAIWADGAVNALKENGVINGYNEGKNKFSFKPENKITRAESIVMLNNSINKTVSEEK